MTNKEYTFSGQCLFKSIIFIINTVNNFIYVSYLFLSNFDDSSFYS